MYLPFVCGERNRNPNSKLTLNIRHYRTVYQLGTNRRQKANVSRFSLAASCHTLAANWIDWRIQNWSKTKNEKKWRAMPLSAWIGIKIHTKCETQCVYRKWAIRERVVCRFYGFCSRARALARSQAIIDSRVSNQICLASVRVAHTFVAWTEPSCRHVNMPPHINDDDGYVDLVSSLKIFRVALDSFDLWYLVVDVVNRWESVGRFKRSAFQCFVL